MKKYKFEITFNTILYYKKRISKNIRMDNYEQNEQLRELKEVSIKLYNQNKKYIKIIEDLWGDNVEELHKKLKEAEEDRDTYYDRYQNYMIERNNLKEENEKYKKEIERLRELVEGERVYKERKCDLCRCGYYLTEEDDLWTDYGTCQECN